MLTLSYANARNYISTGDVIAVKRGEGLLSPFTRFFTRSDYTHVALSIWLGDGLWVSEINGGGNHMVPLSQLADTEFDVYACPVDAARVSVAILEKMRTHIAYGFAALPVVGLLNWLRLKIFLHARQILECAGYCVAVYEMAGWPEHTHLLSPVDLTQLLELKFQVRPV